MQNRKGFVIYYCKNGIIQIFFHTEDILTVYSIYLWVSPPKAAVESMPRVKEFKLINVQYVWNVLLMSLLLLKSNCSNSTCRTAVIFHDFHDPVS